MRRAILITGATGTQGGALIDALLTKPSSGPDPAEDFLLLAVTRNPESEAAKRTLAKSPERIRLVKGDLDHVPALFESARAAAAGVPIWGVFSVQVVLAKDWTPEYEIAQGKALVDEALRSGTVRHFVYTGVDRGGDEHSWREPSPLPQFQPKYHIEQHLRDATAAAAAADASTPPMTWTILRPSAFMENLLPGFEAVVFYAMFRDNLPKDKTMQWIAAADIGFFAAEAFRKPDQFEGRALGLAGDEMTFPQLAEVFQRVTGKPLDDVLGGPQPLLPGFEEGLKYFIEVGYGADIAALRRMHPGLLSVEDWLKKSPYVRE